LSLNYYSPDYSFVLWEEEVDKQTGRQRKKRREKKTQIQSQTDEQTDRKEDRERQETEKSLKREGEALITFLSLLLVKFLRRCGD